MKSLIVMLVLQAFIMSSCSDWKTAKFEVTNTTPFVIDSLYFQPSTAVNRKYISLKPQQTQTYYLDLDKQTTDGAYGIFFKSAGRHRSKVFGYHTNGNVMEEVTKIQIAKDTILFDPIYK
jgi:hypothetical protein